MSAPRHGVILLACSVLGLVGTIGAARATTLLAGGSSSSMPSLRSCAAVYGSGAVAGVLLPSSWVEVLDYAGFVLLLLSVVGLLVGVGDLISRACAK